MLSLFLAIAVSQAASDSSLLNIDWPSNSGDNWGRYGAAMSSFPDWDGDGVDDLLIGSPALNKVHIRSGNTGKILKEIDGSAYGLFGKFGRIVKQAGDVNGDGQQDIFINTAKGVGEIRSGITGSVLHTLSIAPSTEGHVYFEPMPDIDGDGADDFILGIPNGLAKYSGGVFHVFKGALPARVELRSGATGNLIRKVEGPAGSFGALITRVGDLDGDGLDDFGVGQGYLDDAFGHEMTGFTTYSSGSMAPLWSTPLGLVLAAKCVGDINGDGVDEVAIGTSSSVIVRSGANGAILWGSAPLSFESSYGTSLDTLDFNGDGYLDILVGAHEKIGDWGGFGAGQVFHEEGFIEVLDGRDGTVLVSIVGDADSEGLGAGVSAMGDTNGDGVQDFAVASAYESSGMPHLQILSGVPVTLTSNTFEFSLSMGGNQSFDLKMGAAHAGEYGALLGTASGYDVGLTLGGVFIPLNVDPYTMVTMANPHLMMLDSEGRTMMNMMFMGGLNPALVGIVLHHAYLTVDLNTLTFTGASLAVPTTLIP